MRISFHQRLQAVTAELRPLVWAGEADVLTEELFTIRHAADVLEFSGAALANLALLSACDDARLF